MRKPPVYTYESIFASEINSFLKYRIAGGGKGVQEPYVLKTLDDVLLGMGLNQKIIEAQSVDTWIASIKGQERTKKNYVSIYRMFTEYLHGFGYAAYVPPSQRGRSLYVPHIFTQDELRRIFEASDNIVSRSPLTDAPLWFPVMVRMLYGCGLRVGEAVSLQNKDIDWKENVLLIRAAKGNKDRLVPMSRSLGSICRAYYTVAHTGPKPDDYFFHSRNGNPFPTLRPYIWMRYVLEQAGIDRHQEVAITRGICVHCLRHTFAVHTLQLQNEKNIDRFYSIPILSTYMGHTNIYGTEQYLQLTPEYHAALLKQSEAYAGSVFPEVLP